MSLLNHLRRLRIFMLWLLVASTICGVFSLSVSRHTAPLLSSSPDPLSNHAQRISNIPYCRASASQSIDLYLPPNPASKPYPIAIYVHGGGWSKGDKRSPFLDFYGQALINDGIAVASINYRLAPKYHFPAPSQDVSCAISKLASLATRYSLDLDHTTLLGDSAGGLLVSMYALTEPHPPVKIRGVVSFYGTTDLIYQLNRKKYTNQNAYNYLGNRNLDIARLASPLYQPLTDVPPFLFFHGENDTVVSIDQAKNLYRRISAAQPSSRFVSVKHAGHGFSQTSSPTRAEIRDTMLQFIESQTIDSQPEPPLLDRPLFEGTPLPSDASPTPEQTLQHLLEKYA